MTTVIDPGASDEAVFFNKSGTAILNINITDPTVTTTIPAVAGRVIVVPVSASDAQPTLVLDANFQPGDEVRILPRDSHYYYLQDEFGNVLEHAEFIVCFKISNGTGPSTNWVVNLLTR